MRIGSTNAASVASGSTSFLRLTCVVTPDYTAGHRRFARNSVMGYAAENGNTLRAQHCARSS